MASKIFNRRLMGVSGQPLCTLDFQRPVASYLVKLRSIICACHHHSGDDCSQGYLHVQTSFNFGEKRIEGTADGVNWVSNDQWEQNHAIELHVSSLQCQNEDLVIVLYKTGVHL